MTKIILIEGMSCGHCSAHIEKVLNSIDGVTAKVDLATKKATCQLKSDVDDNILKRAIDEAGYEVISITH